MPVAASPLEIHIWPIDRLILYARNPRKNDAVVDRMCSSIREFGFKIPVLARSDGEVVDGHLRIKEARKLRMTEIPSTCRSPDSIPAKSTHCWSRPKMTSEQMRRCRCQKFRYPGPTTCGCAGHTECCAATPSARKLWPGSWAIGNRYFTDPAYAIELDSEWRDRAGLNGCGPAEPSYMKKRTHVRSPALTSPGAQ